MARPQTQVSQSRRTNNTMSRQFQQVVDIIENKRKQARLQQKLGLVQECGNALGALLLAAVPNTHLVDVDLLKRLMGNVVTRESSQEMGATMWTQTCSVCGVGAYGADMEQHDPECAAMALARELGWVQDGVVL